MIEAPFPVTCGMARRLRASFLWALSWPSVGFSSNFCGASLSAASVTARISSNEDPMAEERSIQPKLSFSFVRRGTQFPNTGSWPTGVRNGEGFGDPLAEERSVTTS